MHVSYYSSRLFAMVDFEYQSGRKTHASNEDHY